MSQAGNSPDSNRPLAGQVSLVTGASRGIGAAIAQRLGEMGSRVAICARNQKALDTVAEKLRQDGVETLAQVADVTRHRDVAALVAGIEEALAPIDILVNNAGIGLFGPAHQLREADWDNVLDTNLKGVFLVSKEVAPGMIHRRKGHIINIGSLAGKNAFAGGSVYCASKWGLMGLTYSMAEELRVHGIRVSVICPGSVATEFSAHAGKDPRKMLQPSDVAHAVAAVVTQAPESFISEILIRPKQKP